MPTPPAMPTTALALFDLDHTLTTRDTFLDFCRVAAGTPRFAAAMARLSGQIALFYAGKISNTDIKQRLLMELFAGTNIATLVEKGRQYALESLPRHLSKSAWRRLVWHQERGHRVYVVSASVDLWIQPWCDVHGLGLLATGLEVREGRITGQFSPPNCFGPEKARRVLALLQGGPRPHIYAYGDSDGDREMLALADEGYFKEFPE